MSLPLFLLFLAALFALWFLLFGKHRKPAKISPVPAVYREILAADLPFYRQLAPAGKTGFERRMMRFLDKTRIIGVGTEISDRDRTYIAASAVMPIFGLGDWEYNNLDEVLVYPGPFDHEFRQSGEERNILGMVGEGALQRVMILSQQELHDAFRHKGGRENTAVHEFVHLIDKSDGSTDGVPEFFLGRGYIKPWLQLIHREINLIRENHSDINAYGITNDAEFFAVASEYFFEQPGLLAQKHPELYALLVKAFHQDPANHPDNPTNG